MAYFAMLSGQGWTAIAGCRQFFYARYADWLITTPLLILLLGLVAGAGVDVVAGAIGSDGVFNFYFYSLNCPLNIPLAVVYIIASYMGSVSVVTTVKWFWFLISIAGIAGVLVHFAVVFKRAADSKGSEFSQLYGKLAWLSILVWLAYPIVWLFSEGFASTSVSFEVCAYSILDIFSKVVLCFMVLSAHDTLGVGAPDGGSRQFV